MRPHGKSCASGEPDAKEISGLVPLLGKETVMYKAVRTYTLLPGSSEEFLQRVQESFVPLISQLPGFIAYDTYRIGNDQVITIITCEGYFNPRTHDYDHRRVVRARLAETQPA